MVRSTLPNSCIVGFYTYSGTVVAASSWGGKHRSQPLTPALESSFEALFHKVATTEKAPQFFVVTKASATRGAPAPYAPPALPCTFSLAHSKVHCTKLHGVKSSSAAAPSGAFVGVERVRLADGTVRLKTDDASGGVWITEYTPKRNITVHLLPVDPGGASEAAAAADGGGASAAAPSAGKSLVEMLDEPRLQRWVGVQYHPATELQSHYGEMRMARCYNVVVFVDKTSGLRPLEAAAPPSNKRLFKEYHRLMKNPVPSIEAHPLEHNVLEWHFVLRCVQQPYSGGEYHGMLEFPAEYPMKPPRISVLTPSGRFEANVRLCLSMSDYHPETWNPSWSVETVLLGLQSFMYEESNAIGSIERPLVERIALAKASAAYNTKNAIYRELFGKGAATAAESDAAAAESAGPVCRFCFTVGELVSPCNCKGSNQHVHLECLRKWQKSVLLSQSTHPKFQTNIDTHCNICLSEFTGVARAKSRHEQIVAYTGKQVIAMIKPGSLIVASVDASQANLDLIAKHPEVEKDLAHWCVAITRGTHYIPPLAAASLYAHALSPMLQRPVIY